MSIFDRIGGSAAVTAAVDDFYRRVIGDPVLAPHFDGIDMKRLQGHQRSFLAAALGGPEPYPGRAMHDVHAPFALPPEHFDLVVDHLVATLADLGIGNDTIDAVGARLAPVKNEIARGRTARAR
ncbi:MAG: group 1 truncated hemoglobin [Actinomycetota bacterium]|nr:group 1 truncated hemoglobin [Actinomycetota bacterium]